MRYAWTRKLQLSGATVHSLYCDDGQIMTLHVWITVIALKIFRVLLDSSTNAHFALIFRRKNRIVLKFLPIGQSWRHPRVTAVQPPRISNHISLANSNSHHGGHHAAMMTI